MEILQEIFESLLSDKKEMKNFAMFFLTTFVNSGVLHIHWDLDTQQFVFTACDSIEDDEPEEKKEEFNADELLSRIMNRRPPNGLK